MANSYHQLGVLAQDRGDYAEAERRYQQSLTIKEELGNRAGMAYSISQLGVLHADTQKPTEAVTLHCRALAIRLEIGVPQASFDIARLRDLRTKISEKTFTDTIRTILDEQSSRTLVELLDHEDRSEQEDDRE